MLTGEGVHPGPHPLSPNHSLIPQNTKRVCFKKSQKNKKTLDILKQTNYNKTNKQGGTHKWKG